MMHEQAAGTTTILDEAMAQRLAARLAEPWEGRWERMLPTGQGALLVLDIDGVMINPGRSFHAAVEGALGDLRPALAFRDAHFDGFKRVGGFNNDFRLAAAALVLDELGRLDEVLDEACTGWPELEARFAALEPHAQVHVQRHYETTRRMEQAVMDAPTLAALGHPVAILTGRPPEELLLAQEVLGFELPSVCDAAPHLRKPEPAGLLMLAEVFGADRVLFAGDTPDDALCLRRARALAPGIRWTFAGIGPARHRFLEPGDRQADTLRELLQAGLGLN